MSSKMRDPDESWKQWELFDDEASDLVNNVRRRTQRVLDQLDLKQDSGLNLSYTGADSIQLDVYGEDNSYCEIEIFENSIAYYSEILSDDPSSYIELENIEESEAVDMFNEFVKKHC